MMLNGLLVELFFSTQVFRDLLFLTLTDDSILQDALHCRLLFSWDYCVGIREGEEVGIMYMQLLPKKQDNFLNVLFAVIPEEIVFIISS